MDYIFCQTQQDFTWEGREGLKFTYTEADTWALQKPLHHSQRKHQCYFLILSYRKSHPHFIYRHFQISLTHTQTILPSHFPFEFIVHRCTSVTGPLQLRNQHIYIQSWGQVSQGEEKGTSQVLPLWQAPGWPREADLWSLALLPIKWRGYCFFSLRPFT